MFSNETYDRLKWVAQIFLPAFTVFVAAIFSLLELPYGTQVVGVLSAFDAFLGALLKKSSDEYEGDGTIYIDDSDPEVDRYTLAIPDYVTGMQNKDTFMLKIRHPQHMAGPVDLTEEE